MDLLSTSGINSLISSFTYNEINKRITPLKNRQTKYETRSSSFSALSGKIDTLKSILSSLKETGSDSIFAAKKAESSNSDFVTATATSSAGLSNFDFRTSQLAKSDSFISSEFTSADSNSLTGTHSFVIKTGDGSGGEYVSNIDVDFTSGETNETALTKIQDAINSDKAVVTSSAMNSASTFTGSGAFVINLNGTENTINYDYTSQTYDQVIDDLVSQITSSVSGVTAEKVTSGSTVQLKLTVDSSDNYITIDQTADTGTLLGSSELNINVSKEKGASGIVSASLFSPTTSKSQFSITAKSTGVDYRIKDLSDSGSGAALSTFGLDAGTTRTAFDQSTNPDTAGFIYADITDANNQLNAKFEFNGISMQRNSNTISDLVSGVTFELKSIHQSTDKNTSVSVKTDTSYIKEKVDDFITKFNDVYTYIKNNTTAGVDSPFRGDANISSLYSTMRTMAYSEVSGIPDGELQRLSQIGITFSTSTGLSLSDSSTFESVAGSNVSQMEALFNSTSGIANSLYDTVDPFLGIDGYLSNSQTSLDNNISYLKDKIESTQTRIDKSAEVLRSQYEKLQIQLATLYSSQSFFGSSSQGFF